MRYRCCYECRDRHVGCHAECEKYLEEKAQAERERQVIFAEKGKEKDLDSYSVERSVKRAKRRRT